MGVETTQGTIAAPIVVVIAGAWANQFFAPSGIELGLLRIYVWICAANGMQVSYHWLFNNFWE